MAKKKQKGMEVDLRSLDAESRGELLAKEEPQAQSVMMPDGADTEQVEGLKARLAAAEAQVAALTAPKGIVDAKVKGKIVKPTMTQEQQIEREIRRYVKRTGGFCKNLPEADKARTEAFLKRIGRKHKDGSIKVEWDLSIVVPGYKVR